MVIGGSVCCRGGRQHRPRRPHRPASPCPAGPTRAREELVRAGRVGRVVRDRGEQELVGAGGAHERVESVRDRRRVADEAGVDAVAQQRALVGRGARPTASSCRGAGTGSRGRPSGSRAPTRRTGPPARRPARSVSATSTSADTTTYGAASTPGPERLAVGGHGLQDRRRAHVVVRGERQPQLAGDAGALARARREHPQVQGRTLDRRAHARRGRRRTGPCPPAGRGPCAARR